jgi:hypothetical protein
LKTLIEAQAKLADDRKDIEAKKAELAAREKEVSERERLVTAREKNWQATKKSILDEIAAAESIA